jgi:outer membrane protein OmpA-like peptidoglycan-associated protein
MKFRFLLACLSALLLAACQITGDKRDNESNEALTVKRFVDSHNAVLKELQEIKATSQQTLETAQRSLALLEEMSRRHGTGEITVFFPVGGTTFSHEEKDRLVHFADFLSREARGRKILLVSIGSASAFGDQKFNLRLAEKRAGAPIDVMDKYLVNIPHEFHKVYGTGDLYSPKGVKMKEHERYQHARVIAVFDSGQLPGNMNAPVQ